MIELKSGVLQLSPKFIKFRCKPLQMYNIRVQQKN